MGRLLTGRSLSARRAYELGLVNEVVADDLDAGVGEGVGDILRCAPLSVRAVQQAASRSAALSLEAAFATHYLWEERRVRSQDALEGPDGVRGGSAVEPGGGELAGLGERAAGAAQRAAG